jgi:hypothetical protein
MRRLVVFLNELSCLCADAKLFGGTLVHVLAVLESIKEIKNIRADMLLACHVPLTHITFCGGTQTFATLLGGNYYRDQWRLIASLDQSSPWGSYEECERAHPQQEVRFQNELAVGMTYAKENNSLVLSFGYPPNWTRDSIVGEFWNQATPRNENPTNVNIANIAAPAHVSVHLDILRDYGRELLPSSVVHVGDEFVVRMYSNDHPPPHFHVMLRADTSETEATCSIDTGDIRRGCLSGDIRRAVKAWATENRNALRENWDRCRRGLHLNRLE